MLDEGVLPGRVSFLHRFSELRSGVCHYFLDVGQACMGLVDVLSWLILAAVAVSVYVSGDRQTELKYK